MTTTVVSFEELLQQFRSVGGAAVNVRRDRGEFGYGLFPIDPELPVKLHAPENVLVPAADVEVRDGELKVRQTSALGPEERTLFENTHRYFGWNAGTFDELWSAQVQWSRLPAEAVRTVRATGALDNAELRFADPAPFSCLYHFVKSRDFTYEGKPCIAPILDFTNHSSSAKPFVIAHGVGVEGTFTGEVLVRYNVADAWAYALTYGFADASPLAYSLPITVDISGKLRLSIRRDFGAADVGESRIRFPQQRIDAGTIDFSFLMLGHARQPDLPRGVFRKLLRDYVAPQRADEVFDSILRFNHTHFLELLRTLRAHENPLARMLEDAAIHQLESLCANVGARAL